MMTTPYCFWKLSQKIGAVYVLYFADWKIPGKCTNTKFQFISFDAVGL